MKELQVICKQGIKAAQKRMIGRFQYFMPATLHLRGKGVSIFLFFITFFFAFHLVWGQEGASYKFYEIDKIQSNEVIKGIIKDDKGFIWLATDQGVLRFDGNETTMFFKELPSPFAKKFIKRKNGQLLVLTDSGLKEIIQNADTTYFKPLHINGKPYSQSLNYGKSIFEDREGNLWVGESNAVVKISENEIKRYPLDIKYQSINYHRSFSFTEDAFGHLWIAPYSGRLLSYNEEADSLEDVVIDYPVSDVTGILTVQGDYLLIGGKEGLLELKIDSHKNILESNFLGGPLNISTIFNVRNTIYAGTWDNGLFYGEFSEQTPVFSPVESIPFNDILDFYIDENIDEVWITGSENIGLLKPSLIKPVTKPGRYRIEALTADSLDRLYFSTGEEIFSLSLSSPENVSLVSASQSTYFDRILLDGQKLWIGDAFGGISYFDLRTNQLIPLLNSGTNAIKFIEKDYRGNKWFTGKPGGVYKVSAFDSLQHYEGVKRSIVIRESPQKELFCGAEGLDSLLFLFNPSADKFELLNLEFDFKPSADIRIEDMTFDSLGMPWLATNEGLVKISKKKGNYIAERILLKGIDVNEPIKAIAFVEDNLWLAYSFALAVSYKGEVLFYTRENGLPSRLLKERCFFIKDNNLFVATAKGLAQINSAAMNYEPTPTPLFKAVLVNGVKYPVSEEGKAKFPYGSRMQVEFVSLSYPGTNVLYQTRLIGLEDDWSEPSPISSISVLGFSEGNYTLQVRARDNGFLWSEPLQFDFTINSPWFKAWWAILLFIILGIFLIWVSIKIYHYHLINQKRKLQRIIEVRTKEINQQKNEIIAQKNKLIQQKEELIEKNNAVFKSQQALSEADLNYLHLKEKQLQDQIEYRNKQITTHTLNIIQKNEMLQDLRQQLEGIIKITEGVPHNQLRKLLKIIDESFRIDKDWEEFKLYFEQIYTGFYAKLKINYPELTNQELRHCALIRLNLSNNECASILGISPNSIKVSRTRLRKKLNLEHHHSLTDFVMGI